MSTNVASVTSHFPKPQPGFTTTTSGSVSSGATTVGLNSTGDYSNGDIVALVIDPTDSDKKQVLVGTVDTGGVQLTGVVWTDGTDQSHASGATVVDMVTATHLQMMTKGMLVQHKQDGTHADTITTNTIGENSIGNGVTVDGLNIKDGKLNTNNSVVTDNYTDGSVTPAKLTSGTGSSWAWQSYVPTWTNLTVGNGTLVARYTQIGKTIHFQLSVIFGSTTSISGGVSFTAPVDLSANYILSEPNGTYIGASMFLDASTASYQGSVRTSSATTLRVNALSSSGAYTVNGDISSTVPFNWGTADTLMAWGTYEAA